MSDGKLDRIGKEKLIHVTTRGRKTSKPHTVELWFATKNDLVYLSHEGKETDWMKNIRRNGQVSFEIGGTNFSGTACYIENNTKEAWECKVALYEKYYSRASKEVIADWFSLSSLLLIEPNRQ